MELKEKKRLEDVNARSALIQARLEKMGDVFKGNDKEL
jgi:hypothetical protein